jgi:hypothetical protein
MKNELYSDWMRGELETRRKEGSLNQVFHFYSFIETKICNKKIIHLNSE